MDTETVRVVMDYLSLIVLIVAVASVFMGRWPWQDDV